MYVENPKIFVKLSTKKKKCKEIFCDNSPSQQQQNNRANQILPSVRNYEEQYEKYLEALSIDEILDITDNQIYADRQILKMLRNRFSEIQEFQRNRFIYSVSGASAMKKAYPNYYQSILKQIPTYQQFHFFDQIDKDINRSKICFANDDKDTQQLYMEMIVNILYAYAIRNPYLFYCQGLNFVVAFLINQEFTEEQSFWIFVQLLECILPIDYYLNNYTQIVYQKLIQYFIEYNLPEINEKFQSIQIEVPIISMAWFVGLFTSTLNSSICQIFWEKLFLEGERAFFKAAIAILKIHESQCLEFEDQIAYNKLETMFKTFNNQLQFINQYNQIYINKKAFIIARDCIHRQQKDIVEQEQKKKHSLVTFEFQQCEQDYPICKTVQEFNRKINRHFSFFAFREKNPPQLIQDYFSLENNLLEAKNKQKKKNQNSQQDQQQSSQVNKQLQQQSFNFDELLIGRQIHICQHIDRFEFFDEEQNQSEVSYNQQENSPIRISKAFRQSKRITLMNQEYFTREIENYLIEEIDNTTNLQMCRQSQIHPNQQQEESKQISLIPLCTKSQVFRNNNEDQNSSSESENEIKYEIKLNDAAEEERKSQSLQDEKIDQFRTNNQRTSQEKSNQVGQNNIEKKLQPIKQTNNILQVPLTRSQLVCLQEKVDRGTGVDNIFNTTNSLSQTFNIEEGNFLDDDAEFIKSKKNQRMQLSCITLNEIQEIDYLSPRLVDNQANELEVMISNRQTRPRSQCVYVSSEKRKLINETQKLIISQQIKNTGGGTSFTENTPEVSLQSTHILLGTPSSKTNDEEYDKVLNDAIEHDEYLKYFIQASRQMIRKPAQQLELQQYDDQKQLKSNEFQKSYQAMEIGLAKEKSVKELTENQNPTFTFTQQFVLHN